MPKSFRAENNITTWSELPVLMEASDVGEVIHARPRFVRDHAAQFGGVRVAGKWLFSKQKLMAALGVAEAMA